MDSLNDWTYWLLVRLTFKTRHDFAQLAEQRYGLTVVQLYTLCLLNPDTPMPMNVISCQLICDASNVTGIVDRLASQALIDRRDNPKDRRLKLIALTPKGAKLRSLIVKDLQAFAPEGLARLNTTEQRQLHALLQKVLMPPR